MQRLAMSIVLFVVLLSSFSGADAWEANYPSGPVRSSTQAPYNQPAIKLRNPPSPSEADRKNLFGTKVGTTEAALAAQDPTFANLFSRRTVAYPSGDGAELGYGWDFLSNQKKLMSCVEFNAVHDDKYQTVDSRIQQTVDEETLDISLNTSFDVSAKATIEVVKASGEAKFSLNASHHMSTSDTTFIAHESATNGIVYAGPKANGILLRSDMAKLAATDGEAFRDKCGDGYVATIGKGADLYVMLHAHDLTTEDKVDLETSAKASAGIGDVFSGGASGSFSTKIDDLIKKHSLDIEFVQQGGIFTTVPTNLDEVRKKVQTFMGEEKDGPRALYVNLIPYSELPNWPALYMLDTSDMRQRATRYFQRLQSILYEVRNMRENYFRDDGVKGDKYLFDYAHQLREDNLGETSDLVRNEMDQVDQLLKILDGPDCKAPPVSGNTPSRRERLRELGTHQKNCEALVSKKVKNDLKNFNDFRFWITLPLPLDGVSEKDLKIITDFSGASGTPLRQRTFAQALYRYWIERTDQVRCRLFFECLGKDEQDQEYTDVVATIVPPTITYNVVPSYVYACAGENPGSCGQPYDQNHLSCDQRDFEARARLFCEKAMDSFRHSWTAFNSRSGNQCGYVDVVFTCYNFTPPFPNGK